MRSEIAVDLWPGVFAGIDAERWAVARRDEGTPQLSGFVAFQRIAAQHGRPELAEEPALRLIVGAVREEWHRSGIGLHHLSHVLRLARDASPPDIEGFLCRVTTPDWVDERLASVPPGGLAGALHALATTLEPAQRKPFLREALAQRVTHELSRRGARDAEAWAQALSLLGSASAIGLRGPVQQARWLAERELAEVLEHRAPDPDRNTIGHLQVQLWLGLREMARWRAYAVAVSPPLAGRVLELWQATDQGEAALNLLPHTRALNAGMIAWLQRCQAAGWRLVPPDAEPVPAARATET